MHRKAIEKQANKLIEANPLKWQLIKHSKNIEELIKFLENKLKNKILLYFQIHSNEGFEFPIGNHFIATNKLPEEFKNIYKNLEDSIVLRFLCNTNTKFSFKNHKQFCNQLNKKYSSPIFFISPYQDSCEEECSYLIEAKFEIKLILTKQDLKYSIENYLENNVFFDEIKIKLPTFFKIPDSIPDKPAKETDPKIILDPKIIKIIDKAKNHMKKGDCYLANITTTQTISEGKKFITITDFFNSWLTIFSRYGIYYSDVQKGVACFSPERFIFMQDGLIATEPIKGTLKSKSVIPTVNDAHEIWKNKKEIYEHTLVVDLMRNDLYQVCIPDSVLVYRPFYARISGSLIQMQSFILGKLKKEENLSNCLAKMLPAGSITGTPKKRVCEIISNLEQNKRGYYTGICGILEQNGNFDTTILIRSIYMGQRGIYYGVGAGITTLSNTRLEFEEFEIKLNSFLPAIEGLLS